MGKKQQMVKYHSFFGIDTHPLRVSTVKMHLLLIITLTILTNLSILYITTGVFHSFVDLFDISIYYKYAMHIMSGQIPYADFSFEYPVLFLIPVCIPFVGVMVTQDPYTYVAGFQVFMTIVDIIIAILVYFIALRSWKSKNAFYAGILCATAFSSAYFTMTKSDAFPTLFLVAAIFFTIWGYRKFDYLSSVLGFFIKVFPALIIPYQIIYNWNGGSRIHEIKRFLVYAAICAVILLVPVALIYPEFYRPYLFATGAGLSIYVNTATYSLYAILHDLLHLGVSVNAVSNVMYMLMVLMVVSLMLFAFFHGIPTPQRLIVLTYLTLFAVIFFTKFHSPQYLVWITPFMALALCGSISRVFLFYIFQGIAYIEFPLMWNVLYVNQQYIAPIGSSGWFAALFFFSMEAVVFLIVTYAIIAGDEKFTRDMSSFFIRGLKFITPGRG